MSRRATALLALAVLLPLTGCGRAGPPRPPGPAEAIIFPRAYPKPDAPPVPVEAPAPR